MRRNLMRVLALALGLVFAAGWIPAVGADEGVGIRDTACSDVTAEGLEMSAAYTLTYGSGSVEVRTPIWYSTSDFEDRFTYTGDDLGAVWTPEKTTFRVWAPTADAVWLNLYESGDPDADDLLDWVPMNADVNGTWVLEREGDLNGIYYTYSVAVDDVLREACDPYARTTGVNGIRAMVIDLDSTDPEGWENDKAPHTSGRITDAILYELHIRDLSSDASSGIANTGKFLGLIETGTVNATGQSTGLDHIKNLGITHIQLMPSYDYASVDETDPDAPFNWGYDPVNYNVPEGSYSTDPYHGEVRVKEFKQMVQGLHENGIGVVLDVVYNHVYSAEDFCFNSIVPGYFSRIDQEGTYSNGSACGNDTASERSMVRKYIVDSVKYWADEYHVDGFRFDLLGLIDVQTVNEIIEEVRKTHPHILFYGEGWEVDTQVTKDDVVLATQANSDQTSGMAYFSDTIRDAVRGSNSDSGKIGYAAGADGFGAEVKDSFLGDPAWAKNPSQVVNYVSSNDGLSLFDRLAISTQDRTQEERVRMNNLAAAIVMTSQGAPFYQAGEELLRTRSLPEGGHDDNSDQSPDSVNSIKWDTLADPVYQDTAAYYAGLAAFRKAHPALRMTTAGEVSEKITQLEGLDFNVNAFHIAPGAGGEENELVVIFNPNTEAASVALPDGPWEIHINGEEAGTTALGTAEGSVEVAPISAMVLVRLADCGMPDAEPEPTPVGINPMPMIAAGIAAAAAVLAAVLLKKKKSE